MKILLISRSFYPEIGGLHPIADLSAREWIRQGYEVRLLTNSIGTFERESEYPIFRRCSWRDILKHYKWADVVFFNHVSIYFWLPLLLIKRPYVVSMSGWVHPKAGNSTDTPSLKGKLINIVLQHILNKATKNIAACAAVAAGNRVPARIIPNPFDQSRYSNTTPDYRDRRSELLFVGRLVPDKGADDLLRAVALLQAKGLRCEAIIVGKGSEERKLKAMVGSLGISDNISFLGAKSSQELFVLMNSHRILIVPSKWNEPIAISALEALACGCVVIGTEGGGLAVTIGDCGLTYPNGDYQALAERIEIMMAKGVELHEWSSHISRHLERYTPPVVCKQYLEVIEEAFRAHSIY